MSGGVAYRHKRKKPMGEINVVPYIDVMLVLLVIFMITAPLLTQGVKVDLPQAAGENVTPGAIPPLLVNVKEDRSLHLTKGTARSEQLDVDGLMIRVAAELRERPETPVYVGGDRNVPYGTIMAVIAVLKQSGVPSVGLLTEPPE
jgi:biopolymer transport protein TolR